MLNDVSWDSYKVINFYFPSSDHFISQVRVMESPVLSMQSAIIGMVNVSVRADMKVTEQHVLTSMNARTNHTAVIRMPTAKMYTVRTVAHVTMGSEETDIKMDAKTLMSVVNTRSNAI